MRTLKPVHEASPIKTLAELNAESLVFNDDAPDTYACLSTPRH